MIYTVTFNPAIDYIVRMNGPLAPGMTNRSISEDCYFGGKGINVSTVLKNLDIESTALGFAAGFTGEAIVESVRNSVGAGDSMVAGFIAGYIKSGDHRAALRMGAAAGSATAFSDDLATGELIDQIYGMMSEERKDRIT
ncbi:MAG: hypothetical protein K6G27_07635 [Lachnospiraceae bacterium]|nr:hypothetical protein [Lachnospiraceae bacterium]